MQGARAPQPGATNRPSPSGHTIGPSAPDRSQRAPSLSAVRPPGRPERRPAPSLPAPQRPPGAGGPGGRGTPGPMPNPEVKPASAEGTAGATLWETRAPPAPGARCAGRGTRGGPPLFRLRGFYPHTGRGCRLSFSLRVRFRPRKAAGTAAGARPLGRLRAHPAGPLPVLGTLFFLLSFAGPHCPKLSPEQQARFLKRACGRGPSTCVWQRFSRHFGCPVPTIWQKNRRCLRFLPSRASRPCPSSCSCR